MVEDGEWRTAYGSYAPQRKEGRELQSFSVADVCSNEANTGFPEGQSGEPCKGLITGTSLVSGWGVRSQLGSTT